LFCLRADSGDGEAGNFGIHHLQTSCTAEIAMNVVVRGEEVSKVFLVPINVGRKIIDTWNTVLHEENIDIFAPLCSQAVTVVRTKEYP
jgi:hypothetical protein